jgi:outer membrane usher protein FimD/PapC
LNSDIWVPSTDLIKPQTAHLYTVGYTQQLPNIGLEFSIESYHKTMKHQIDYRQGISFFDNVNLDWQKIIEKEGIGKAYGLELMVRKEAIKYNGWLSYTLSKSERQFENINHGAWYPHKYDRLHNLNLTFEYKINQKWNISSSFVYQTGSRVTLPAVRSANNPFIQEPLTESIPDYPYGLFFSGRNNQKLPDYHRLDIAFSKHYFTKKKHRQAQLTFGVYNAYGKINPYTLTYSSEYVAYNNDPKQSTFKPSLQGKALFVFIPSISYNLKW